MKRVREGMKKVLGAALGLLFLSVPAQAQSTSDANLSIRKTASTSQVTTGNTFTYSIDVTNIGHNVIKQITVKDNLPVGTTLDSYAVTVPPRVSYTSNNDSANDRVVTISSLAARQVATIFFVVRLNANVADGVSLTNTASASFFDQKKAPPIADSVAITASNPAPLLSLPADITTPTDTGKAVASVIVGSATASDNTDGVRIEGKRSDGQPLDAPYSVGTTRIVWIATDSGGATSQGQQTVTVEDREAPTITAPPDVVQFVGPEATSAQIVYLGHAVTSDNCEGEVQVSTDAPNPMPLGVTTVIWTATDVAGNTATDTQQVTIKRRPATADDSYNSNEDQPLQVPAPGILGNDRATEGRTLTCRLKSGPTSGVLNLAVNGSFTYTPASDFNGPVSFTYIANDGSEDSTPSTVTIDVASVNDAPLALAQQPVLDEDETHYFTLGGTDADNDALTYHLVSVTTNGVLGRKPNTAPYGPEFYYIPKANFSGTDSFTFKVFDGQVYSNVATVTFTIRAVNDAPKSFDNSVSVAQDVSKSFYLTSTDVENEALSYTLVQAPAHGTLSAMPSAPTRAQPSVTYTPEAGYVGSDSFTWKTNDGTQDSNLATVSINVFANKAPTANDDAYSVDEDTELRVAQPGIRANDSDPEGQPLWVRILQRPQHGVFDGGGGGFYYKPYPNFNGTDSFTYVVNDGYVDSAPATVTITVKPVNDAPTAQAQSVSTMEDIAKAITLVGLDPDGDTLQYTLVSGPSFGSLRSTSDAAFGPNVVYEPRLNTARPDSFTFKVSDGQVESSPVTVSITVTPVNDAPIAQDMQLQVDEDGRLGFFLFAQDIEYDPLTYTIVSQPQHGTLTPNPYDPPGRANYSYTPSGNFNGADSFTFKVNDGQLDSAPATATITVRPVNDAPVASDTQVRGSIGVPCTIILSASDVDGDPLNFFITRQPQYGTLSAMRPGPTPYQREVTYTPGPFYTGSDSFEWRVNDGALSDYGHVEISQLNVYAQDPPVAVADFYTTAAGQPLVVKAPGVLGNDVDTEGDQLSAQLVIGASHGAVTLNPDGSFTYTPATGFTGTDSFHYQASDGQAVSNSVSVSIAVTLTPAL